MLGKADVNQWLRSRPKPARPSRSFRIKPSVSFDSEASASATLIELDVFYVTAGGDKLTSEQQAALRERLLKVCEG